VAVTVTGMTAVTPLERSGALTFGQSRGIPNPTGRLTGVDFSIAPGAMTTLRIYDAWGARVSRSTPSRVAPTMPNGGW
jgi:hypothetical protein